MAEGHEQQGFLKRIDTAGMNLLTGVYDALFRDGALAAAGRQGLKELGDAFGVMTPESIQVSEPGAVWNPLYSDIAADRRESLGAGQAAPAATLPSPSEIGREAKAGTVQGEVQRDRQPLPSPSEIGREQRPDTPQPGREHGQEHGREM
jgi:hypothetical protein